jgi:hypothetical protein
MRTDARALSTLSRIDYEGTFLAARGIGLLATGAAAAFAVLALGLGAAYTQSPRSLVRHPGPGVLTATAALAWWGAL